MTPKKKQKINQAKTAAVLLAGGMTALHPGIALMSSPYPVYAAETAAADPGESISESATEEAVQEQNPLISYEYIDEADRCFYPQK